MRYALAVGAIVIGGVGAGLAVERAGLISVVSETAVVATLDEVPYFECPDEQALGDLHRGDRVYATGRSMDGEWVEVRAPYDTEGRVWVLAGWLTPDSNLQALPGVECELSAVDAAGEPAGATTTSTTTPPSGTTSTAGTTSSSTSSTSSSTSVTSTAATTSTSSTTSTTTTTLASDSEGPVIQLLQSTEADLWENANYGGCPSQQQTAVVSAAVGDPSGISTVELSWSVGTSSGTVGVPLLSDPVYSVTIGPFPEDAVGADTFVFLQMTARDSFDNETSVSSSSSILLHNCAVG